MKRIHCFCIVLLKIVISVHLVQAFVACVIRACFFAFSTRFRINCFKFSGVVLKEEVGDEVTKWETPDTRLYEK